MGVVWLGPVSWVGLPSFEGWFIENETSLLFGLASLGRFTFGAAEEGCRPPYGFVVSSCDAVFDGWLSSISVRVGSLGRWVGGCWYGLFA